VSILSTVPVGSGKTIVLLSIIDGPASAGTYMDGGSEITNTSISGPIVDCGIGSALCPGDGGHICIMRRYGDSDVVYKDFSFSFSHTALFRGEVYFSEKAKNCEDSGAIAAVIFNNNAGKSIVVLSIPEGASHIYAHNFFRLLRWFSRRRKLLLNPSH
jgi:hypothetical protein